MSLSPLYPRHFLIHLVGWCCALILSHAGSALAGEWVRNGPSGGNIRDLIVSPHSSRTLFAAASADGLFRSTDSGRSWQRVAEGLDEGFCAVVADPTDAELLYGVVCSSNSRVARSFDGGLTWQVVPGSVARALVVDPLTPSTLYSIARNTVGKSTDQGATWEYFGADQFPSSVSLLAIDPVRPTTLYATSFLPTGGRGVWKSTNAGELWVLSSTGVQESRGLDAILVDPVNPDVVYLGTGSGLFRSLDAGGNWELDQNLPPVKSLTVDPEDSGTVYALADDGERERIFRTLDQGATWEAFGDALPATGRDEGLYFRKVVTNGAGRWFAASECGVYRTGESAVHWSKASKGLRAGGMNSIVANSEDRVLYAGNFTCGTFRSSDGGGAWTRLPDPSSTGTFSLAIDPKNHRRLYSGTQGGLYRGRRGGRSWKRISTEPASGSGQVARDFVRADFKEANHLFAGFYRSVVFSRDGGASWSLGSLRRAKDIFGLRELVIHPQDSSILFVATRGQGVQRSDDGGATWRRRNRGFPRLASRLEIWDLGIDPQDGNVVYASLPSRGLYKTVNGGRRWLPANGGIETLSVLSILVDPQDSDTVYVGTLTDGVFRSRNAGQSWRRLGALDGLRVYDLAIAGTTLHAAGTDGIYSYDLSD